MRKYKKSLRNKSKRKTYKRKTYRRKTSRRKTSKRKYKRRFKQKGGLSWPFGPEIKNMGSSIGHGTKGFLKQFNPDPPSAPANPKNMNVDPLPYKGQYARQTSTPYNLPDIPNFWETSNADTKAI